MLDFVRPVRRWKEGERLYAENSLFTMVYVVDVEKAAQPWKIGLHGPDQMCVEFITPEQAKPWDEL